MNSFSCGFRNHCQTKFPQRGNGSGRPHTELTAALMLLLLILPGCEGGRDVPAEVLSGVSSQDCYLCGGAIEDRIPFYWGQNNLALISLNTFDIQPVEINRYGRLTGQLIEESTGTVSFGGVGGGNGGFSASLLLDCDRGYADGSIYFHDDAVLDTDRAATLLCADHLNELLPRRTERCFGVGVMDLSTGQIRILEDHLDHFTLGDFFIGCDWHGRKDHPREIDILFFYCPVRYEKEP